jgi:pimeloyl-ACP methyl ester carboxylesterase
MKNIVRKEKEGFDYRFNLEVLTANYQEITLKLTPFTQFEGETLFLSGEKSGYIGIDDEPLISAHFPKATIVTVKNAGHWLHADNPSDFYDETVRFIDK